MKVYNAKNHTEKSIHPEVEFIMVANSTLPSIDSVDEFDNLNLNDPIFVNAAQEIIARHQLPNAPLSRFEGTNIVFAFGDNRVIKIFPPNHHDQFLSEVLVMKHLQNKLSIMTPAIEFEGEISGWPYLIMSRLHGTLLEGLWETLTHDNKLIIIRELGALIREVHSLPTQGLESIDSHWEQFIRKQIDQCVRRHQTKNLSEELIQDIPAYLESIEHRLPKIKKPVLLTGEYTPMNFLVTQTSGVWHISGLIDFGDAMLGLPQYDLLGPGAFLIQGDKILLREFFKAYGYSEKDLTSELSHQMMALLLLHRYSWLNLQIKIEGWQNQVSDLKDLENLVWGFETHPQIS
jgi:hygromycin-B 7''-O-kinase